LSFCPIILFRQNKKCVRFFEMPKSFSIEAYCKTDPGVCRTSNEDTCLVDLENSCFLVADGVGGNVGGDLASAFMRDSVAVLFDGKDKALPLRAAGCVREIFSLAHRQMKTCIEASPSCQGMGCTAELLIFSGDRFFLGHIGDSRTYRFRRGGLEQLTVDHSLVQEQLDLGIITPEQARKSRYKNVILKAVGGEVPPEIDSRHGSLLAGDIYLLCTDGLYDMVSDEEILSVLRYDVPLAVKVDMLVDMANNAGGRDNIAVTLVGVGR
jgi:protein phosphatase